MALDWKVVHGGKTPPPGDVVRPDERLSWGRTVGLGAQHVVAIGAYHAARAIAPPHMREEGALILVGGHDTQRVDEFVEDASRADERVEDDLDDRRDER
jgi:hypothetical protein